MSKNIKKDCVVRISLKAVKTAKEHQAVKECRKETTSKRAAIEGTNSALKRSQGLGKMAVRGKLKCSIVANFMVTALIVLEIHKCDLCTGIIKSLFFKTIFL